MMRGSEWGPSVTRDTNQVSDRPWPAGRPIIILVPMTRIDVTFDGTREDALVAPVVCLPIGPSTPGRSIDPARTASAAGARVLERGDETRTDPIAHRRLTAAFTRRLAEAARVVAACRRRRASSAGARDDVGSPRGSGWELATGWTRPW
jgi:hypothetical protein